MMKKKEKYLKNLKEGNNICHKKVSMYHLEYISLFIDIIIGFFCSILSLIMLLDKEIRDETKIDSIRKWIGPLGIVSGIIGSILTLVYIIYSEYIFNNGSPGKEYENPGNPNTFSPYNSNKIYRLNEERAFAEWTKVTKTYECFYYNENDEDSFYIRYKELKQRQYNYNREMYLSSLLNNTKLKNCNCNNSESYLPEIECRLHTINSKFLRPEYGNELWCPVLVFNNDEINKNTKNKYIYDRWLTTIIFCYIIIILNFALTIIGILIFKENFIT